MAVKIRLSKRGRKKLALYDIVVASQRAPRDGRFIEKVGNYNPNTYPATITLEADKMELNPLIQLNLYYHLKVFC